MYGDLEQPTKVRAHWKTNSVSKEKKKNSYYETQRVKKEKRSKYNKDCLCRKLYSTAFFVDLKWHCEVVCWKIYHITGETNYFGRFLTRYSKYLKRSIPKIFCLIISKSTKRTRMLKVTPWFIIILFSRPLIHLLNLTNTI